MDYAKAQKIRNKSFGTLLAEQEGGFGESLKKTISQKTQAKMTGIKEKFDPMNMVKFMTGGSNWAPAMLGKLTNRKQSSIDFFTGVKRRGKGTADKLGSVDGGSGGGDFLGILQSIESLLHTTREEDKLKSEEENNFAEEKALEKARRHKELMEALTGKPYKEKVVPTATKEDDEKTSWVSWLDGLGWLKYLVMGPGLGLTALLAGIGIGAWLLQKLADNTNNMKALSPDEAQAILQGNDAQFIEDNGGREHLENIIKNGKQNAQEALNMPEGEEKDKKLRELGGEDKVKNIAKDEKVYDIPPEQTSEEMGKAKKLPFTKEEFIGKGSARKSKEAKWEKLYAPYYDDNGNLKTATPVKQSTNAESSNAATPVKQSTNAESSSTPIPDATSTATPASDKEVPSASNTPPAVIPTPVASQALANVQKENLDLKTPQSKPDEASVVNNTINKSSNNGGQKRKPIPPVRNPEITFQRMILKSTRVV